MPEIAFVIVFGIAPESALVMEDMDGEAKPEIAVPALEAPVGERAANAEFAAAAAMEAVLPVAPDEFPPVEVPEPDPVAAGTSDCSRV